jgi:hypothetical protein
MDNNDNADNDNAYNNDNDNINIINNNYYAEEYRIDNNYNHNHEPMNSQVLPIALRSNMLRMLHELRVPLYALGALGGGARDNMEQEAVEVLARSLYDSRPVKHVIDIPDGESGEKHGIREMVYDPETAEKQKINTACGIWQEEFEAGEAIKVLPCNHAFRAEAITKWLTTEKAECPICRFKLASKEVIVHSESAYGNRDDGDGDDNDDDNDDGDDDRVRNYHYDDEAPRPQPQQQPQPQHVNEQRARENNIMNRQNIRIHNPVHAGGAADIGRDAYYGISMPMNQLLQMRGRLVHGGRVGGGGAAAAAASLSSQPSQPSQPSQVSQPPPPLVVTNINNYYINRISQYHVSAEEQEEADIEEAIRRSLQ